MNLPAKKKANEFDLDKSFEQVLKVPLEEVAPKVKENKIPMDQVNQVIEKLSVLMGIPPQTASIAIFLLFLMGAANDGAPLTMSVEVGGTSVSRRDLLYAYENVTGNKFLRRLAETLAIKISQYAEKHGLRGDLARRLDNKSKAEKGESLTPKELAWCSSFCQWIPDLETHSGSRVATLLADDYNSRFSKAKKQQDKGKPNKNNKNGKGSAGPKPTKDKQTPTESKTPEEKK